MLYRARVRIGLLTREYPPDVYGGAGVHVEHLVPARVIDYIAEHQLYMDSG